MASSMQTMCGQAFGDQYAFTSVPTIHDHIDCSFCAPEFSMTIKTFSTVTATIPRENNLSAGAEYHALNIE